MARKKKPSLPFSSIREYEASPYWKNKSKRILDNKECACEICRRRRWREYKRRPGSYKRVTRNSVHHKRYDNIGTDKEEQDLMVLCWQCHDICHLIFRLANMAPFFMDLKQICIKYGFEYDGGYGGPV